jgi:DNA polymerase-3 subunit epsilon
MIKIEFERLGYDFKLPQLCTVQLSKKLIPGIKSYKLGNLVKSLGIPISNRHRASGDALATVELFKILLLKDSKKEILTKLIIYKEKSTKSKWFEIINKLPNETGVYYLYNFDGKLIYIGKSKNIKNRVNQHLIGKSNKSLNIQLESSDVSYEKTGSELIALLKENNEIKKHKPKFNKKLKTVVKKFALEVCDNKNGNKFLRIVHYSDDQHYLEYYSSLKIANRRLEKLNKIYGINGISEKDDSLIEILINDLNYKHQNMLIIDKGRNVNEKSVIMIKDYKYLGYGFFNLNHQINNLEILESLLIKNEYVENSKELILNYLRKNNCDKIIDLDLKN